jgi:hypothetical protein
MALARPVPRRAGHRVKIIITKNCKQCLQPFQFISRREGRRGSHRVYCEVCRELRTDEAICRFKARQSDTEKRLAIRANAIKCHEVA